MVVVWNTADIEASPNYRIRKAKFIGLANLWIASLVPVGPYHNLQLWKGRTDENFIDLIVNIGKITINNLKEVCSIVFLSLALINNWAILIDFLLGIADDWLDKGKREMLENIWIERDIIHVGCK